MASCSRPFWDLLAQSVSEPTAIWTWLFCPYTINTSMAVVGAIILMMGFVGLYNWSESWTLPLTWLALVAPVVAAAALPGGLIRQIAGILTVAFAMLLIGIWYWWGRG